MSKQDTSYVKKQITMALLKLIEKQEFERINITDIVKEAMVGRASFYRNFQDKTDVLKQYLMLLIKNWGKEFEQEGDPNWVKSLFGHYYQYKDFYLLLYRCNMSYLIFDTIKAVSGPKREQDNISAYFSAWFCGGLFAWIDQWITRGMSETPDEMVSLLESIDKQSHEK